jgi:CitMHS family citrate-Mg2+:H+ or citrate-Ca2+:H+ symporter
MLAIWGLITIIVLLVLIMTKRMMPVMALIVVPVVFALCAGFGAKIGGFILDGVTTIAGNGVMFIFAILFFGILSDAGTFDPIITGILKIVKADPIKICIGVAILAMCIHLDGSGAVVCLVTIPAFLPIFDKLKMRRTTLATIIALGAGAEVLPWTGPTIRAATSLKAGTPMDLFQPMLIPVIVTMVMAVVIAGFLGWREKRRLTADGTLKAVLAAGFDHREVVTKSEFARPKLFIPNIILIVAAIAMIISGLLSPAAAFMIAFVIALFMNYPKIKDQGARIKAHASDALSMGSVLFAAGAFTGIMTGSGMINAMGTTLASIIPASAGPLIPLIIGLVAMPLSLLFDPDSFYFGMLPVLATTAAAVGVPGLAVGYAALAGQMTTGWPISPLTPATFLLTGMSGVELGEHQKKTIPWLYLLSLVMLGMDYVVGII